MFHLSCFNSTPFHRSISSLLHFFSTHYRESNRIERDRHFTTICAYDLNQSNFYFFGNFSSPKRTENGISRINGACTTRYFVKKGGTREIREILQHARSKNWPTFFRRSLFTRGQISFLRVEGENRVNDSFRSFSYAKIWKGGGLFYGN